MGNESKDKTFRELYFDLVNSVVEFVNDDEINAASEFKPYREQFCNLRHAALITNAEEMSRCGGMVSPGETPGGKDPWKSMAGTG